MVNLWLIMVNLWLIYGSKWLPSGKLTVCELENHHAIFMGSHPLFRLGHAIYVANCVHLYQRVLGL